MLCGTFDAIKIKGSLSSSQNNKVFLTVVKYFMKFTKHNTESGYYYIGFQGCTKLKSAWGLNFKINFRPDFHAILCCLVRPKIFIYFESNIYIYIYIGLKKSNNNNMNKKTIFWWSSWTMALTWDEYLMLVSALIDCKLHIGKQFTS